MLRFLAIVIIAAISYFAVGYGAGQWSWAMYIGGAVVGFGIVLEVITFLMRPRMAKVQAPKMSMPAIPQEEPERIAARIDGARREGREAEQVRASFNAFLSGVVPTVAELQKLISLLHQGTYGKLSPAAEEALQQAFDKTSDLTRALETFDRAQRVVQAPPAPSSMPVAPAPLAQAAPNPGIRSLKINSDEA